MRGLKRAVLAAAAGLAGVWPVAPAHAAPLACGSNIVADTVLHADVGPCATPAGLNIGADGVVLDLNGHRVFGVPERREDIGIYVGGRHNVTVRNGTVTGFRDGVYAAGAKNVTITKMSVVGNVGVTEGSHSGSGIQLALTEDAVVTHNTVRHNGPTAGVVLRLAVGSRIAHNVIADNAVSRTGIGGHGEIIGQGDMGIWMASDPLGLRFRAVDNQVIGNLIRGNGHHGLFVDIGVDRTVVRGNVISGNGVGQHPVLPDAEGVLLRSNANRVTANEVRGNSGSGIRITPRWDLVDGVAVPVEGLGNRVERNVVLGNGHGPYFGLDQVDDTPSCDANVWAGNVFRTAVPDCAAG